jgi:transposase-like protein
MFCGLPEPAEALHPVKMKSLHATDPSSTPDAIHQLKRAWGELADLDRAQAVFKIKRSGTSIRQIARQIGKSESLLRHLLKALDAPAADRAAARQGNLSTNELIRRTKAEAKRLSAQRREADERVRGRNATQGAKLICDWLQEIGMVGTHGEQIVDEARQIMIRAIYAGSLPHGRTEVLDIDRPRCRCC